MNLNKRIFILLCVLIYAFNCKAQISPDSLVGTYVGEYWFRHSDSPWEISENDTVWVYSVDTSSCTLVFDRSFHEPFSYFSGWNDFETKYDFCYGNSYDFYKRFYALDSLEMRINEISPSPPNFDPVGLRFYGKKISSDVPNVVQPVKYVNQSLVFPNLFRDKINISFHNLQKRSLRLLNANGGSIFYIYIDTQEFVISTTDLSNGLYFLQITSNNSIENFKLLKQ